MEQNLWNPYLPLWEYIPDGEPHVFDGRLYIYGSHDEENGNVFCPGDYTVWSAPETDLSDWRCEGVIYKKEQDPANADGKLRLYAPDVVRGNDGRYYLYYGLSLEPHISVAVSDTPAGRFEYLGMVRWANGIPLEKYMPYDPAVLNDEGRIYLYYGFAPDFPIHGGCQSECPGCCMTELDEDMLTIKAEPKIVIPSKKYADETEFAGHAFFEAPSIRKAGDKYYLVYDSQLKHELCYAVSDYPDREFRFGGTLISNGDIGYHGRTKENAVWSYGNIHGGMVQINEVWYIFYHRHTHGTMYSRQGCAERIEMKENGTIQQVCMTSCGLNQLPLKASGVYPAAIACNLWGEQGTKEPIFGKKLADIPIVSSCDGEQFITQVTDGTVIGYKNFWFREETEVKLEYRGEGKGRFELSDEPGGVCLASIDVNAGAEWQKAGNRLRLSGEHALYIRYTGNGELSVKTIEFVE